MAAGTKHAVFRSRWVPYTLLAPQLAVLIWFFFWPAAQAVVQAFFISDAFGGNSRFTGMENFMRLLTSQKYLGSMSVTAVFSAATATLALAAGLLLAVAADRTVRTTGMYRALLIWPYAVAPAVAGALWLFLFHPGIGVLAYLMHRALALGWDPTLRPTHAMVMLVLAAAWKQVSYNFVFFLAGLQAIPQATVEAAALDGAGPVRRFATVVLPLLFPTTFFLMVMNLVYAFFDTFGIVHNTTGGGPACSTTILVYKIYQDGFVGLDFGSSSAQSVLLMALVVGLTVLQFRLLEQRTQLA